MPEPKRKWLFPHAAELEYTRLLKDYAARIIDKIRAVLHEWLNRPQHDRQWQQALSSLLDNLEFGAEQNDTLKGIAATAAAVNRFNDGQFHAVVKSAVGLDFVKAEPWLDDTLRGWINENTRLIKDVPTEHLKRIQAAVYQAQINGTDTATLAKILAEIDKMPMTRAELIAADQIGKLNGQLSRQRQQSIGVKKYRWRTMQDKRVRDRHIRREGKVYEWDNPPSGGHPGSEIRCRCWAAMILPELEEMDAQFFGDGSNRNHYEQMRHRRLAPLAGRPLADNPYARYQYVPRGTRQLPDYIETLANNKAAQQAKQLSSAVTSNTVIKRHLDEMQFAVYIFEFSNKYQLTTAEQQALFAYTRLGAIMNKAVYRPESLGSSLAAYQELNHFAGQALSKLPDYRGTVIRYIHAVPEFLAIHQTGKVVTYRNLTSASVHGGVFSNRPVKITIQSLHGKYISHISALPQQQEVLFKADSRFKVLSYRENEDGTIWIELKEID